MPLLYVNLYVFVIYRSSEISQHLFYYIPKICSILNAVVGSINRNNCNHCGKQVWNWK